MNGYVDTREGWRELDVVTPDSIYQLAEYDPADGSVVRAWVREVPLPTEPGYYLGQQRGLGPIVVELLALSGISGRQWVDAGDRNYLELEAVAALGPLVRLEPRAVTAKAVLGRVRKRVLGDTSWSRTGMDEVAREFGVEP